MEKKCFIMILLLIPTLAMADIYKCIIDGRTTFSGSPCERNAEKIELKVDKPSSEDRTLRQQQVEKWGQIIVEKNLIKKRDSILKEIRKNQYRIDDLNAEMESELAALRYKKQFANNSLAGATWEQSISDEMNAVSGKYQVALDSMHRDIDRLKRQADRLTEQLQKPQISAGY